MMRLSFAYTMLFYLQYILMFLSTASLVVIGIIITVEKLKPTKILGVAYIVSAVSSCLNLMSQIIPHFLGVRVYSRFSIVFTVLSGIVSLVFAFCICFFIHKRYGAKLIYIPVLLVPVTGGIANMIVAFALNRAGAGGATMPYWISLTRSINSFVTGTVSAIAVIIVLYKNRKREDIVPLLWIFKIFTYVWTVASFIYTVITYLVIISGSGVLRKNMTPFMRMWTRNMQISNLMFIIVGCLESLIIPIYVLVMILRKSPKQQTAVTAENKETEGNPAGSESL